MTEKAGKAEGVTGFDEEFESLCSKMDQIKLVTERMLAQVEILIQPNPSESATHAAANIPIPFLQFLSYSIPFQMCVWRTGPGLS